MTFWGKDIAREFMGACLLPGIHCQYELVFVRVYYVVRFKQCGHNCFGKTETRCGCVTGRVRLNVGTFLVFKYSMYSSTCRSIYVLFYAEQNVDRPVSFVAAAAAAAARRRRLPLASIASGFGGF